MNSLHAFFEKHSVFGDFRVSTVATPRPCWALREPFLEHRMVATESRKILLRSSR